MKVAGMTYISIAQAIGACKVLHSKKRPVVFCGDGF